MEFGLSKRNKKNNEHTSGGGLPRPLEDECFPPAYKHFVTDTVIKPIQTHYFQSCFYVPDDLATNLLEFSPRIHCHK